MSEVVAFVHAKGTSERLPGKNMADLGGQPLFTYAVRNALAAKKVDRVVVDSDSDEILDIGKSMGAEPLKRPKELATNNTDGDKMAWWQASQVKDAFIIVQVVPTSPFIKPASIDTAVVLGEHYKSVVGIRREQLYLWENGKPAWNYIVFPLATDEDNFSRLENNRIPNSVELPYRTWETTGLYVVRRNFALMHRQRINRHDCIGYPLSRIEAIDINTQGDLDFARIVLAGMNSSENVNYCTSTTAITTERIRKAYGGYDPRYPKPTPPPNVETRDGGLVARPMQVNVTNE